MSIRLSIQSCFEYPLAFVGWLISNPMQFLVGFATIKFVVMEFDALADWNFKELAFLYGMSVLSHGLSVIFFTKTWYMGWTILRGEMDMLRLRPMNTLFQFLFGEMNFVGLTDLVPGVILFVYGCISVQFQWTLHNTAAMLCAVVGGTLLRGAPAHTVRQTRYVLDLLGYNPLALFGDRCGFVICTLLNATHLLHFV